jgi:hypothetical protein
LQAVNGSLRRRTSRSRQQGDLPCPLSALSRPLRPPRCFQAA